MPSARIQWLASMGLLIGVGAILAWQHRDAHTLQTKIREIRDAAGPVTGDGTNLQTISASELKRLRDDRLALERLRREIDDIKRTAARSSAAPPAPEEPSNRLVASAWSHAGRTSPQDAVITILWAGKHRNFEIMSSALAFESDEARARATEVLVTLPEGTRTFLGTPERLLAQLIAQSVDFDAIQFLDKPAAAKESGGMETVVLPAAVHRPNKAPSRMALSLQHHLDGWKLVLPEDAVDAYATRLRDGTLRLP